MRIHHLVAVAATAAVLLASIAPAGAALGDNSLTNNALIGNGVAATGSRLGDLNGVAVEAVSLPARQ